MVVEYIHPMVCQKWQISIFDKKFPRSKKGVATLGFPQGFCPGNFFWWFYIPIRVDSATKTLCTNFFTDQLYYSLTINELDNADNKYNKFVEIYTKHYDTAYPLISRRVRRKNERVLPKPWITEWLEDACNRKNLLYYEFVENPNEQNKTKYDKMCKFCEKHIAIAKKKYYKKYFDEHLTIYLTIYNASY